LLIVVLLTHFPTLVLLFVFYFLTSQMTGQNEMILEQCKWKKKCEWKCCLKHGSSISDSFNMVTVSWDEGGRDTVG
jgi:hypothetical protein